MAILAVYVKKELGPKDYRMSVCVFKIDKHFWQSHTAPGQVPMFDGSLTGTSSPPKQNITDLIRSFAAAASSGLTLLRITVRWTCFFVIRLSTSQVISLS